MCCHLDLRPIEHVIIVLCCNVMLSLPGRAHPTCVPRPRDLYISETNLVMNFYKMCRSIGKHKYTLFKKDDLFH